MATIKTRKIQRSIHITRVGYPFVTRRNTIKKNG